MRWFIPLLWLVFYVSVPPGLAAPENQNSGEIRVELSGLVCDFCARAIEKTFSRRDEVAGLEIDLTSKILTLQMKPGADLTDAEIDTLVKNAGYNVVKIERGEQTPDD